MSFNLPFDLEHWLINVFAGNANLFVIIAFIAIASIAGYFRMPNSVLALMFLVFVFIMGALTGEWTILAIVLIGGSVAWLITKVIKN